MVFGSHRRAQGVIVSWQLWQQLAPVIEDALDSDLAKRRITATGEEEWLSYEQLLAALGRDR